MNNSLKQRLAGGRACYNGWSLIPSPICIEGYAQLGWDSLTIDMQHGWWDYATATSAFMAMQAYGVTPMVRVPWNEPGVLGKVLDAGAQGIICPMVNTVADAQALVRGALYPPIGQRSTGPVRGPLSNAAPGYQGRANDQLLLLPQIETGEAVDNLEAILDVEGISGVYVGPSDLGLSLGLPAVMDQEEERILAIYERVIAACAARGKIASLHNTSPAYAARMVAMGYHLVTVGSDLGFVLHGAGAALAVARQTPETGARSAY
ncbi:aldolase/citrate lyase family protein [Sphingomonas sp. RP10(2022)]|uniref:Aldolase/citrate lyase family protein n=1 Tax=Sphingomonas liriopis TaxID=2949094 RepID=A0A9X2HN36_9SPHN|nr:aldolase/citrate lyase family protein [Sphingomonas liriopis]MCP3734018.1 aldolase/citrate lyase family protein [Sphingomonas liriopis]